MDCRWKVTNTGHRSPGTRVPMVAQILQRNVDVVKSELPAGLAPSCVAERPSAGKRRVTQLPHDQCRYATVGEYLIRLAAEQESRDAAPAV